MTLLWTEEQPTVKGFYFMDHYVPHLDKRVVAIVHVNTKEGEAKVRICSGNEVYVFGTDQKFLGPIVMPHAELGEYAAIHPSPVPKEGVPAFITPEILKELGY